MLKYKQTYGDWSALRFEEDYFSWNFFEIIFQNIDYQYFINQKK